MTAFAPSRIGTAFALLRLASAYAAFALLKHVVPLRTLTRLAWTEPRAHDAHRRTRSVAGVVRIGRAAGAHRGDCLQLALLLYRELSRCGDRPVLVAGLRQEGGRTLGHAWVEVNGVPVADAIDDVSRFTRAVCFGERGRPLGLERFGG
jgi:hypothetical protein